MPEKKPSDISRRGFIRRAPAAVLAAGMASTAAAAETPAPQARQALPRRVLGRTNLKVTCMALGTACCGMAQKITPPQVTEIVSEALDLGVNYIDTAPGYGNAEEGIGPAIVKRRKQMILGTKVFTDSVAEAEKMFTGSLTNLKTDYVDLLYFHQLGGRDVEKARGPDGVFTWLLKQKKAGKCRFAGVTCHDHPGRVAAFLETGQIDVMMVPVNFIDDFVYGFEKDVLPLARKHNVGIVAMKVFAGPSEETGKWWNPEAKPNVGEKNVEMAIRYALSTPDVATANLGVHNVNQMRQNVKHVAAFKPLSDDERKKLATLGRQLAGDLGEHYGPVAEKEQEET
ncbi:MAG: aldo/keto reductase [Candidatus Nealsonbacteria bacterium]|nr:aldo/keto reductase [Candidatus Nealsonbacteria bacterium]